MGFLRGDRLAKNLCNCLQFLNLHRVSQQVLDDLAKSHQRRKNHESWTIFLDKCQILILLGFEISIQNLLGHHVVFTLTLFVTIFKPQQKQLEQLLLILAISHNTKRSKALLKYTICIFVHCKLRVRNSHKYFKFTGWPPNKFWTFFC